MRVIIEKIAENWSLLLLLLAAAEKEIKQAFSRAHLGRQRHGANDGCNDKHAAQPAPKGQFGMQRSLHLRNGPSLQH
ncbi:hypothetical protein [Bradyrhizobium sp. 132]|uniref:hypothetical protein n=1 Tax=Bradyrhizobium sp. 132 TaxID=2782610 RepID=UPI001FF98D84|nr:hypothetical protein [Bradyrhizobium sp. 132]